MHPEDTTRTPSTGPTTRRTALRRLAAGAAAVALAGCAGESDGDDATTDTGTGTGAGTGTTADTSTAGTTTDGTTGSGGTATTTASDGTATKTNAAERGDYTVGMYTDLYFDPVGLHVEPGDTVSFELVSGAHSATAYHPDNPNAFERRVPEGAPAWDTGTFGEKGAFRNVTFETAGTHDYYCIPHKMVGMVGRVVVGDPGGPATASENPDLSLPTADRIVEDGTVAWSDWESEVG
ncbi:plastocyanin/azurin family copper-binding protein [Halobium salinum]|uniref:Plastocyanin/azurin family copper-binding protein n=1 Tax=Halobium salinum TaxID=1364940 RepID=A0ABD5PFK3_9EURY|nr:plastocyanin/azurin family copper-binding protein [Halobium salinum]